MYKSLHTTDYNVQKQHHIMFEEQINWMEFCVLVVYFGVVQLHYMQRPTCTHTL